MARNALSYGDTDSDNPLARAAAYAAPWTTDGADTSVGAPSIGAGVDAVGQWMAAQLAKMQGSRPTAPIWNPDNPVGTETTQSMGMPQPTVYAGPVGQFVDPATGQLTTQGQARMADNPLLGFDTGGIGGVLKGFHGSPHAFDRFDNAAIGTGEGAQAYGYGHYLADSEGVARSYRDDITAKQSQRSVTINTGGPFGPVEILEQDPTKTGHMYEVNVAADPEHFLDWDKPLSEQHPVVQNAVQNIADKSSALSQRMMEAEKSNLPFTGRDFVSTLARGGDYGHPAIAQALQDAGVPGIRYLDQGSRAAGEGSKNTVIFNPATMEILRRYGLAGIIGGGAAGVSATDRGGS